MPLGRDDFIRAVAGEPLVISNEMFGPPEEEFWPDNPDLRRCVDWFKTFMKPEQWQSRRDAAFIRLYCAAYHIYNVDLKGRYFDENDKFAWYLFLADAYLDHRWNYDHTFGSRVIPIFEAIGRNLTLLKAVIGLRERVARLVGRERRQPNGGIFELLVAIAYLREGAFVAFRPEKPGVAKSYDLDVTIAGQDFAVECKRLETSEYGEKERARMRQLWGPASALLEIAERSTFASASFEVPVDEVPDGYLLDKVHAWLGSRMPSYLWSDQLCNGVVGDLDLTPLQKFLKTDEVLSDGTRLQELLSGRYIRHANYIQATRVTMGSSPRYMSNCDLAVILRWRTLAKASIDGKARDVLKRLSEGNAQLPADKPGIIHIGFEAVEGDEVERLRYEKILATTGSFDPGGKPLQYVYCHYFVPESPPAELWAVDETVQWRRITGTLPRPLKWPFLVLKDGDQAREGPHWQD